MKKVNTKQLVVMALLSAAAYVTMVYLRLQVVPTASYLKFDPKDIFLVFGGFLYGPVPAIVMSLLVCFLEMVTVSTSGPVGLLMNALSSCAFVGVAAFVYKKKRSIWGAAVGLGLGVIFMTIVMILWNYIITPSYQGVPRSVVKDMLVPIFLPFNLLKGGINAAAAMLLYKPMITALRRLDLVPRPVNTSGARINLAGLVAALFVLSTCVAAVLIWQGKL